MTTDKLMAFVVDKLKEQGKTKEEIEKILDKASTMIYEGASNEQITHELKRIIKELGL